MDRDRPKILLVPLGEGETHLLQHVANRLSAALERPCSLGDQLRLPTAAYDPNRGQFRGQDILKALSRLALPDAYRVLGMIDADCYAPGLNFIFGQAQRRGRNAFIALPRLRPSFYGKPKDRALFRERAVKEAGHELGHTYGLDHCSNPKCVMHFSNRLRDTDLKSTAFCESCKAEIAEARSGE
jgi:archaemetzincin